MRIAGGMFALMLLAPPVAVSDAPRAVSAEPAPQDIVVTGLAKLTTLNAKEFARAVKAHRELRAVYAPQSRLMFEVLRGPQGRSLDGITLTLVSKDKTVPVALDADYRFTLPDLPGKGWKLVANRREGNFGILPLVMSPGTGDADRLLGDLRLQCEVIWAMAKPDLPLLMRAFAGTLGGFCKGSVLPFMVWSDRTIADAWVANGALTRPVDVAQDRHAFRPPVADKTLPHTARVRFRYR